MDDLSTFCCQNLNCPDHGQRGAGNLSVCAHYGSHPWRLLYCRTCKARFSERKGTALFNSRLPEAQAIQVFEHLAEGCGVRATGRLTGVHRDTVGRLALAWRGTTPRPCMTSWWLFPPQTQDLQFDEKWSFVGKKEEHCDPDDPADARQGDNWDHVALDPESRLVLAVVPGKRTTENTEQLVAETKRRLGERLPRLITTDEYRPYQAAILKAWGEWVTPPRTGKPGRPRAPYLVAPEGLHYAVVHKTRDKGRVIEVAVRVIFGALAAVLAALAASRVSRAINTAFIERQNGTDRHRNGRKRRKTYCFSKDWTVHEAMTDFTQYSYNFCWPVRTLRQRVAGRWQARSPAMAAGLANHLWSMREWVSFPAVQPT